MAAPPSITILLLGDPSTGKSTFLSNLSHGASSARLLPPTTLLPSPTYSFHLYNRPYTLHFHSTASPTAALAPSFIILCYDISDRQTLINAQHVWHKRSLELFLRENETIPIMLLGLKRDLRVEGAGVIYPQEALAIAQSLRCDRYAECSALTGELMNEVIEDIARTAAKTTTEKGGQSDGGCGLM